MSIKTRLKHKEENTNNIFWTTMADLMLGLSIIFMTLFVLAITGFTQQSIDIKKAQVETSKELAQKLKENNIDAEVDKMTGDVKISNLELFEINSYTLSPNGKQLLNKLIPIYINTIFSKENLINGIENIVIQGHTDSQNYTGINSKEDQFMKNMELSLKRANSVADYMFKTNYNKQYSDKLIKMTTVEGKSFTETVIENKKENYDKSRRVELRLKVKEMNIMQALTTGVPRHE